MHRDEDREHRRDERGEQVDRVIVEKMEARDSIHIRTGLRDDLAGFAVHTGELKDCAEKGI